MLKYYRRRISRERSPEDSSEVSKLESEDRFETRMADMSMKNEEEQKTSLATTLTKSLENRVPFTYKNSTAFYDYLKSHCCCFQRCFRFCKPSNSEKRYFRALQRL